MGWWWCGVVVVWWRWCGGGGGVVVVVWWCGYGGVVVVVWCGVVVGGWVGGCMCACTPVRVVLFKKQCFTEQQQNIMMRKWVKFPVASECSIPITEFVRSC